MPVVLPPVLIPDLSRDGKSGPNTGTDTGCGHPWLFELGGNLYTVTWSFIDPNLPDAPRVRVFKSTNGGTSWTVQDDSNSPDMRQCFDVVEDGGVLRIAYQDPVSFFLKVKAFDTATDTWGSASADGPDVSNLSDLVGFKMVQVASGDLYVFYNFSTDLFGTKEGCKYVVLSGGVWGAPVTFNAEVANVRNPFTKLIYDSDTDLIHVVSLSGAGNTSSITWTLIHNTLTTGGVISAPSTIGTIGLSPAGTVPPPAPNVGRCVIWNDIIVVPVTYFRSGNPVSNRQVIVFTGTPVATPVWTSTLINNLTLPANEQDYESYAVVSNDGLTLWVFFVFMTGTTGATQQLYYASTTDGVIWTDPVLHYDAITNPQSNPSPTGNYIHAIAAIELSGGGFGVVVALQTDDEFSTSDCLGYYLIDSVGPLTLECGNPPDGEVGVAYEHQLVVSGGTLPYLFEIIAGSLPPGLSLASDTGIISGTPTTEGNYPFAVRVTDADDNTDQVECEIDITAGDLSLDCNDPPQGQVNISYSHSLLVGGGTPGYTYAAISGSLPDGLTLDEATGIISGFPLLAGRFQFTVQVTDSLGAHAEVTCTITIVATIARLQIYDDGAGEYLFDAPINTTLCAGNMNAPISLNTQGAIGPFLVRSPKAVSKPGLVTVQITNVNSPDAPGSTSVYIGLIFARKKQCEDGEANKDKNRKGLVQRL